MRLEIEGIVMIACNGLGGSHDVAIHVGDGQEVGGFGPFASLVGHRLAAFLGNGMAAIKIEFRKIQIVLDGQNACFPCLLEASIPAPLAKVIVNGVMTDFFFSGSPGSGSMGRRAH